MQHILQQRLAARQQQQRWRERRSLIPQNKALIHFQEKDYLSFSSNDYLGLARHPELIQALQTAAEKYGVGSTASALVAGYTSVHEELETAFAKFTGRDRAIFFGSGTLANLGVVNAFMQQRSDTIYQDKLNHASLIDAAILSKAKLIRYPHHQLDVLEEALKKDTPTLRLIVSESVFSMDGSMADLKHLAQLAQQYQSLLMIDDAHGFGVIGNEGKSTAQLLSQDQCPILVCPLGKAFGSYGALVAGSDLIIESILQFARSYTYATAAPAALAAANLVSLKLIQTDTWRREKLNSLIQYFKQQAAEFAIPLLESNTPIQSILIGDSQRAQNISHALLKQGIYLRDIRPPTVPAGTARLRIGVTVNHSTDDIDHLMKAMSNIQSEVFA